MQHHKSNILSAAWSSFVAGTSAMICEAGMMEPITSAINRIGTSSFGMYCKESWVNIYKHWISHFKLKSPGITTFSTSPYSKKSTLFAEIHYSCLPTAMASCCLSYQVLISCARRHVPLSTVSVFYLIDMIGKSGQLIYLLLLLDY